MLDGWSLGASYNGAFPRQLQIYGRSSLTVNTNVGEEILDIEADGAHCLNVVMKDVL